MVYCKSIDSFPHPPIIDPSTSGDSKVYKAEIVNTIVKNGKKNPPSEIELPIGFPARFDNGTIESRDAIWPHYKSDAIFSSGQLVSPVVVYSGWSSKNLLMNFIKSRFSPIPDSKGQLTRFEVTATGAIESVKIRSDSNSHVISALTGFGGAQKGQTEIDELGVPFDDYPKPTTLIDYFIRMNESDDFVVLDFFSGSGTMAHSAYKVAVTDGKKIKFVVVQLPEIIGDDANAFVSGYKTIAEIGKERIRQAGNKIREDLEGQLDLEGREKLDLGFKVLKLDRSNFKQWQPPLRDISDEALIQQMELNVDHVEPEASEEEMLYELLIKAGIMPTEKIETIELAGHRLFSVADSSLLVHLQDRIGKELIDAVLEVAPSQFICLDKGFHGNDQLKANAVKTFEAYNQGREKIDQIDFKTV